MTRSGKRPSTGRSRPAQARTPRRPGESASAALIVFAKAPVAGFVKTRLCPPLTPDEAASLHGSLVLDILERCQSLKAYDRILAGTPSAHHPFFKAVEARFKIPVWDQTGEDLGARMASAFHHALGSPYRAAVIIGTDIPGIQAPIIKTAMESLHHHDVVLGPTVDGGYYLIGLRAPVPELFQDIPWSSNQVCTLTEQKIAALGLSVKLLPQLRDLDTIDDLHFFIQEAKNGHAVSSRTKNVLQELAKRLTTRE